eukprot:4707889-Pyramimonas_sp.AAC.1
MRSREGSAEAASRPRVFREPARDDSMMRAGDKATRLSSRLQPAGCVRAGKCGQGRYGNLGRLCRGCDGVQFELARAGLLDLRSEI